MQEMAVGKLRVKTALFILVPQFTFASDMSREYSKSLN